MIEPVCTRRLLARTGVVVFVLLTVLGWIYVFWFADTTPADKLDSSAFPAAAQPVCAAARQQVRDAGLVDVKADTPQQRAEITDRADTIMRAMVAELRLLPQPGGEDAAVLQRWLADWDTFLGDRDTWVATLGAGDGRPLIEHSHEGGEPASKTMDTFAAVNTMSDCKTPNGF